MKLSELQALFQAGVLGGDDVSAILDAVRPSMRGADRETLFGVYRNAYRIRLSEFLAEDYPALRAFLGEDAFGALVEAYIAATPPRHRNARWYTTSLPDFMRESASWRDNARAISLALFERALVDAFDAADAAPLSIRALAAIAPEQWPRLIFDFHPSLVLLDLAAGTLETYDAAAGEGDDEIPPPREGREIVAVWRMGEESAYRGIAADERLALNEARLRRAFGDICQMAAFQQGDDVTPERLAQFLGSWFEEGLVVAARCDDDESGQSSNTPSSA